MTERKSLGLCMTSLLFVLLILPGTSSAQLTQGQNNTYIQTSFGLRITGGGSLLMRNDLNDHLQGLNDLMNEVSFWTVESEFEMLKMGMDFSGEILISFMPNFSLGIGAGYISAGKETKAQLDYQPFYKEDITMHPRFSAIPITLSFYYGLPLGSSMQVVLNAGAGYYLGTVNYDELYEISGSGSSQEHTESWSAKSNSFGFHGGIDLEFSIAPNLALVVGAKGRYAKLTNLTGDLEWETYLSWAGTDSGTEEDQTLWFGNYRDWLTGTEHPQVYLSDQKPAGPEWSEVREAEVNLSGIVIQAGIKITF